MNIQEMLFADIDRLRKEVNSYNFSIKLDSGDDITFNNFELGARGISKNVIWFKNKKSLTIVINVNKINAYKYEEV